MNAIPLPALDGGQLLLIMVEAARGKPLNAEITRTVSQTLNPEP
jgi:membrane-associated protease RseP (regulator of RpoE activity)